MMNKIKIVKHEAKSGLNRLPESAVWFRFALDSNGKLCLWGYQASNHAHACRDVMVLADESESPYGVDCGMYIGTATIGRRHVCHAFECEVVSYMTASESYPLTADPVAPVPFTDRITPAREWVIDPQPQDPVIPVIYRRVGDQEAEQAAPERYEVAESPIGGQPVIRRVFP